MAYTHDDPVTVATMSAATGIPIPVMTAWLRCEAQAVNNPTNPLNIRFYGRAGQLRGPGATGASGVGFAAYASLDAGARDSAWVLGLAYYDAVRAAVHAHASDDAIAAAIEASPWAAGHYGAVNGQPGCIRRGLAVHPPATPPPPAPVPLTYRVRSGDSLWAIAQRFHVPGGWPALYSANRALIGANPNLIHPGQVLTLPTGSHG